MSTNYKVIKILDEFRIIINAGFEDGIKPGTRLQIFVPGEEIIDPFSNVNLGTLDTIKAEIVANEVSQHVSICTNTATTNQISELLMHNNVSISQALQMIKPTTRPFNIDPSEITPIEQTDKIIKIGDLVRILPY